MKIADKPKTWTRGFALVITLSLMMLLTVIAVGLLSLATISLRSSSQTDAIATARANARMALILAIGDLQKSAGPDQRITARADVLSETIANPRLTGVWKSRTFDPANLPTPADFESAARDQKFVGWMASSLDGKAAASPTFAGIAATNPATLWDEGSLGVGAPARDIVKATKVPTAGGKTRGAFAWAVMDEGVKVRINTSYTEETSPTKGRQTTQLGSGVRPNTSAIPTLSALERSYFKQDSTGHATIKKGISRLNFGLAAETLAAGTGNLLKPLTHDVTSSSVGLFTDTAVGGLKEDFNLLANTPTLPTPYAGSGVYNSRLGMSIADAPSDPRWDSLHQFARLPLDSARLGSSGGAPLLRAHAPSTWSALTTTAGNTTVNPTPPPGLVMLPTLAKVQVVFSLVGRDLYKNLPPINKVTGPLDLAMKDVDPDKDDLRNPESAPALHGPQDFHFRNSKYDYDLHLLYTPVVTLHNPYNVTLEFSSLRVEFIHVPFSMKIFRNGGAQSSDFVPLETMYGDNHDGKKDKIFGMNLNTPANNTTFRLMPGEVKLFSPFIDPARTYQTDLGDRKFWDIYVDTGITTKIDARPGWRGNGIGFDADNLTGAYAIDGDAENGRWQSGLGLAWDDRIHVEFIPKNIARANSKFLIKMSATLPGSTTPTEVNAIEMDFETPDGLMNYMSDNGATMPLRYPKTGHVLAQDLVDRSTTEIGSLKNVNPFALFTVQGKSTSGGRDPGLEDGRLATKPWCFAHANIGASTQKVVSQHPANSSHEIDLQPLNGITDSLVAAENLSGRSQFISGHTDTNGSMFGVQYDVPIAPLQTLVSLNGANPGGSSIYLPRFAQPIGNSWAHPLLDPSTLSTSGDAYPYLDHSYLLNLALYDHFYFSGFSDRNTSFDPGGVTVASLVNNFIAGKPLVDPRLALYTPDGKKDAELSTVATAPDAHTKVAAWQVMNGAFNINSTSVAAWKAMLGSIHDSKSAFNNPKKSNHTGTGSLSTFTNLKTTDVSNHEARISRFRLPVSESAADGGDPTEAYWLGAREYSEADLETLATNIVKQVRERGPFLSMSEFVNRRLGPNSEEKAQRGALQQAIDDSNLNASIANEPNTRAGFSIPEAAVSTYKYKNAKAGAGASHQGAPGYLSQADILSVLGNAATPRSDTFTIRGYGEARDSANNPIAAATCEAVIQRVPDYVDAADKAEIAPAVLTSNANKAFGRRFQVISFRWLSTKEI
ncbi:MAG: hypothetical protein Q8Q59_11560 [Luteolibacter sp.]|jgi:hypothetical protein|nr:hypothetical protein [Luteolibacter sp.]